MANPVTDLIQSCAEYFYGALSYMISSVTGFVFGSDDNSSDSGSDYETALLGEEELFPTERTRLINANSKYIRYRTINEDTKGKNKTAAIYYSFSKRTGDKKLWVSKEKVETRSCNYSINSITTEIFSAWLLVYLLGKGNTPKAKFNPDTHGILSRILGDNADATKDLQAACFSDIPFKPIPKEAQDSFLKAFILAIVIGNRDITFENFIFKDDKEGKPIVYLIDNEFALAPPLTRPTSVFLAAISTIRPQHLSLADLLNALDANPTNFVRIMLDTKFDWNNVDTSCFNINATEETIEASIKQVGAILFESFTQDAFRRTLQEIVRSIEVEDFAVCNRVKTKMLEQLGNAPNTYSQELIAKTITPRIEAATAELRQNVACVNEFLAERGLLNVDRPSQCISMRIS